MNEPSQKEEALGVQVSHIFWRADHSKEENSRLQEGQVAMTLIESIFYYISGTVLRAPWGTSFKDQRGPFLSAIDTLFYTWGIEVQRDEMIGASYEVAGSKFNLELYDSKASSHSASNSHEVAILCQK